MSDELDLIDAAKKGSVLAFTELVHCYRPGLLGFLLTRCPSHADAEDALQDTLMNAYRYLQSYDSRWRFSTWLYRIAIRNVARARATNSTGIDELADEQSDPLAECVAQSERENLWRSARRLLNDEVYAAMWLRYVEDMSIKDIAAVLDKSNSWTKVNLMRGRNALDAEMNKQSSNRENEVYGQTCRNP